MSTVNKAFLVGHVGRDPEIRYTQSGDPVASFSLATADVWKDRTGQKREQTDWHTVTVFGKQAEVVREYVAKGRLLCVEGQIRYEEWTDKEGTKRRTTKIHVSGGGRITLLGKKPEDAARPTSDRPAPAAPEAPLADEITDDDVPF